MKKPAEFQQVSNCYYRLLCDAHFVNFFMKNTCCTYYSVEIDGSVCSFFGIIS